MEEHASAGLSLRTLLHTVGRPLVELVSGDPKRQVTIGSVALVETDELRERSTPDADAFLLMGAREHSLAELLPLVRSGSVVFVKFSALYAQDGPTGGYAKILAAAGSRGVSVVRVHHEASWDQLTSILQRLLADAARGDLANAAPANAAGEDASDLFALAEMVAEQVGGLVTIEDTAGEVLAYSRATEGADELRISSILGRRGPADQMRRLDDEGVLRALATEGSVLRVEANPELGRAARLAVGIFREGVHVATLWVQESSVQESAVLESSTPRNPTELSPDAEVLLAGAARLAANLIRRPLPVAQVGDRLLLVGLGLNPEPDAELSVAESYAFAALINPGPKDQVAVVGFALGGEQRTPAPSLTDVMGYLRLHAASYRRPIALTAAGDHLYGVVATSSLPNLERWAASALADVAARFGPGLRAAVAEAPAGIAALPEARRSVDHLLDAVLRDPSQYPVVVSLAAQRSDVLLREIVSLVDARPALRDPRLDTLRAHDLRHGGDLVASIRCYLDAFGDVRSAAERISVHPNTLRYRLQRAQDVSGLDLGDSATRLVLGVLLRLAS